jgi:hypothetical protein
MGYNMAEAGVDSGKDIDWHWADEQLIETSKGPDKTFIKRALGVLLFFADEMIVALVILYLIYRIFG